MTNATQTAMKDTGDPEGLDTRRRIHLREISGEADAPVDSVGQDLRNARLRRGDEIATVSRALKIRKDHLEALEEDRPEDLPGRTYALGFVRSYAQYLGLDANAFAARYKHDIKGRTEEEERPQLATIHEEEWRLPQGWWVIAAVLVGLLGYGMWYLLAGGQDNNSQAVPPAPVLTQSQPRPVLPKPIVVPMQGQTQPAPASGNPASENDSQNSGEPTSAMPAPAAGPQTPATQIDNRATAQPQANTAVTGTAASSPAVPPQEHVYGQQNVNPRVILQARGATRVTVKGADGELYINRDLEPGDTYRVPNLPGLNLAVANAGAIEIELDGQQLGLAGLPGQVLGRVSLDPQSLMNRFNR